MDVFPLFSVAAAHDRERVHDESLDVPQVAEVSWHVSLSLYIFLSLSNPNVQTRFLLPPERKRDVGERRLGCDRKRVGAYLAYALA